LIPTVLSLFFLTVALNTELFWPNVMAFDGTIRLHIRTLKKSLMSANVIEAHYIESFQMLLFHN